MLTEWSESVIVFFVVFFFFSFQVHLEKVEVDSNGDSSIQSSDSQVVISRNTFLLCLPLRVISDFCVSLCVDIWVCLLPPMLQQFCYAEKNQKSFGHGKENTANNLWLKLVSKHLWNAFRMLFSCVCFLKCTDCLITGNKTYT